MTKKVAIVGAGIVGATAAYQLSKKGIDVTVFDAGVGQATKAAAGIVHGCRNVVIKTGTNSCHMGRRTIRS